MQSRLSAVVFWPNGHLVQSFEDQRLKPKKINQQIYIYISNY